MSLVAKLRLKAELPLVLVEAPDEAYDLFKEFEIKTSLAGKSLQQVIFFALNKNTLDTY